MRKLLLEEPTVNFTYLKDVDLDRQIIVAVDNWIYFYKLVHCSNHYNWAPLHASNIMGGPMFTSKHAACEDFIKRIGDIYVFDSLLDFTECLYTKLKKEYLII